MAREMPQETWQAYILGIAAVASVGFAAWLATAVVDMKSDLVEIRAEQRQLDRRITAWENRI